MSIWKSRTTAVVAGAAVVVTLGATGATAARMITGSDIKNGTVTSADVKNSSLTGSDIKNGSLGSLDIANNRLSGADVKDGSLGLQDLSASAKGATVNKDGVSGVYTATLGADTTVAHIGGPINDNNTDLATSVTLPAGTYLVNVSGAFESAAANTSGVDVYPQLSLWIDHDNSGDFAWKGGDNTAGTADDEGSISPNALMPTAADRHISVSGQTVITLDKKTDIGLLAFGYDSNQGTEGSGKIFVKQGATLTATPLN